MTAKHLSVTVRPLGIQPPTGHLPPVTVHNNSTKFQFHHHRHTETRVIHVGKGIWGRTAPPLGAYYCMPDDWHHPAATLRCVVSEKSSFFSGPSDISYVPAAGREAILFAISPVFIKILLNPISATHVKRTFPPSPLPPFIHTHTITPLTRTSSGQTEKKR